MVTDEAKSNAWITCSRAPVAAAPAPADRSTWSEAPDRSVAARIECVGTGDGGAARRRARAGEVGSAVAGGTASARRGGPVGVGASVGRGGGAGGITSTPTVARRRRGSGTPPGRKRGKAPRAGAPATA